MDASPDGYGTLLDDMPGDDDDGSDIDLLFRAEQTKDMTAGHSPTINWGNEPLHLGRVITPRDSSEASGVSALSRRSSMSSSHSRSSSGSTRIKTEGSVISSRNPSAEDADFTTVQGIVNLRESLSAIPDNSFHSTVTEEVSRSSKHGTEERKLENLNSIREELQMQLMLRTATPKEEFEPIPPPPSQAQSPSPVERKFAPKAKSFLAPVPKENYTTFRTVSPEPAAPIHSTPLAAPTLVHSDADSFHLTPMNKDLSLEDSAATSALPADLSMDLESLVETVRSDVPLEVKAELRRERGSTDRPTLIPDVHSMDLDVVSIKMTPNDEEKLHRSMEDVLCDLPHEIEDEHHPRHVISRPVTASSGGCTTRSGSSSEGENMGQMIRSRMLDGSDFDSNCDSYSESISEAYSVEKGRVGMKPSTPYSRLDSGAMSQASSDSSYHFVNLPLELQKNDGGVAMDVDSEVATASSADDIVYLEELYSDIFGEAEVVKHVIDEEASDASGALSMLGLFKDVESCHSSVVSFDSTDFLEDEQSFEDGRSKAHCSISMHDITTIHEEDEDDIADEDERVLPVDTNAAFMPLNGELHLQRLQLVSQGTSGTGTFSSVTDDSYMRGMSFDSSTIPESVCSYDSFSSESVKYMVDILKEEAERRRSKIQERIAKIRESTEKVSHTTAYAARLMKGGDEDSTLT